MAKIRVYELATKMGLDNKEVVEKLQQAGIQVVDWQMDRPFAQVLHASLDRMPHWFRAVGGEG